MTMEQGASPQAATDVLGTTGSDLGSGDSFGTGTSGSSDQIKDAASRVADKVGGQVDSTASQQFGRAGSMIEHVADALDKASNDLRTQEAPIADAAKMAANQLRSAADYVRSADLDTLRHNAMDLAQRQPALYLGGAMVLGLLASRFLKASPTPGRSGIRSGYGSSGYGASGYGSSGYGTSRYGYGTSGYGDRAFNTSGSRTGSGRLSGYGTAVGPGRQSTAATTAGKVTGGYGGSALDTGDVGGQTAGAGSNGRSNASGRSGQEGTYGRS